MDGFGQLKIEAQADEITRLRAEREELVAVFREVMDHVEYCNWGDSWERVCATQKGGIADRAYALLAKLGEGK